nr:hypothetical protein GCM10025699_58130 [Microbacterium flavescens]
MAVIENVTGASSAPGPYAADPVLVVMGVSGSGKSTLAALLAEQLGWDFYEGDDLHPDENVAKMAAGTPLDDDDRAPGSTRCRRGSSSTPWRVCRA